MKSAKQRIEEEITDYREHRAAGGTVKLEWIRDGEVILSLIEAAEKADGMFMHNPKMRAIWVALKEVSIKKT